MNDSIMERFEALEKRRLALVARVMALAEGERSQVPAPGVFSPSEMIEHFALAEEFDLNFLKKVDPTLLAGKSPKPTFIYRKVVQQMSEAKARVATVAFMKPKVVVNVESAAEHWSDVRAELRKYFEKVNDPNAAFIKMNLLFGTLSADQLLTLLEGHTTYHEELFRPDCVSAHTFL